MLRGTLVQKIRRHRKGGSSGHPRETLQRCVTTVLRSTWKATGRRPSSSRTGPSSCKDDGTEEKTYELPDGNITEASQRCVRDWGADDGGIFNSVADRSNREMSQCGTCTGHRVRTWLRVNRHRFHRLRFILGKCLSSATHEHVHAPLVRCHELSNRGAFNRFVAFSRVCDFITVFQLKRDHRGMSP